jgi:hypothetical protein
MGAPKVDTFVGGHCPSGLAADAPYNSLLRMSEVTDPRQEELARLENLVAWPGTVDRAFTSSLSRRTTSVDSRSRRPW